MACGISSPTRVATYTPSGESVESQPLGYQQVPKIVSFKTPDTYCTSKSKDSDYNYKIVGVLHYHAIYSLIYIIELIIQLMFENRCLEKNVIVN